MALQQEMMGLYSKAWSKSIEYGLFTNDYSNAYCHGIIFCHFHSAELKRIQFLWFNLGTPDIAMTLIAGAVYFIQAKVSLWTVLNNKKTNENDDLYFSYYDYVYFL